MGNQQAYQYSVPIGEQKEGESRIHRHPKYQTDFIDNFSGAKTVQEVFLNSVKKFPNKNLLGTQMVIGNSKHYVYKTYKQCHEIASQLGSGIVNLNLIPEIQEYKDTKLKLIGVFSKNREEWLLLEYANVLQGNTMVPLYDTLGLESIPYILGQTQIATIFVTSHSIDTLLKVENLHKIKNVVTFDELSQAQIDKVASRNLKLFTFKQVLEAGQATPVPLAQVKPTDIFTFSYTSGTTGMPKGAMLRHQNFVTVGSAASFQGFSLLETDVYLSYLPLPHVLERVVVTSLMGYGSTICLYGGDVQKLKDDITLVKPTIFASVPRLFTRLYRTIKDQIDKLEGVKKQLAEQGIASKMYYLKQSGAVTHKLWDNLIFNKTKAAFGGRVRLMISGSAPISGDVVDFLKIAVCCPFLEGYGQTEGTGGSFCSRPQDPEGGHVGGCLANIEFKVVDVPAMKYFSTDVDEQGRLTPRGEVCIRGWGVFAGYYREEEKTAEVIDQDGWLHSGDVGVIRADGSLKLVDRVKNIFKLSQGEYIAPEKVEGVYNKVKGVTESFVYGDAHKSFCVAIIVPDKHFIESLGKELNVQGTFEELCNNQVIVKSFLEKIQAAGKAEKLNGMENVKNLYLEPIPFQNLGLMSNTLKLMRHQANTHFKQQLEAMYQGQE